MKLFVILFCLLQVVYGNECNSQIKTLVQSIQQAKIKHTCLAPYDCNIMFGETNNEETMWTCENNECILTTVSSNLMNNHGYKMTNQFANSVNSVTIIIGNGPISPLIEGFENKNKHYYIQVLCKEICYYQGKCSGKKYWISTELTFSGGAYARYNTIDPIDKLKIGDVCHISYILYKEKPQNTDNGSNTDTNGIITTNGVVSNGIIFTNGIITTNGWVPQVGAVVPEGSTENGFTGQNGIIGTNGLIVENGFTGQNGWVPEVGEWIPEDGKVGQIIGGR